MFTWTPDMIRFMHAANETGTYHQQLADILAPKLTGCRTLCDAGCGLGALSAALSSRFDAITAADVSDDALDVLRQTILARGLTNITPLHCDLLSDALTEPYDGMIFCFFGSLEEILPVARRQCRKTLIIIKKKLRPAPLFPDRAAPARRDGAGRMRNAPRSGRPVLV